MPAQIGILFEFGECLNPLPDPPDIELAALTRRDPDHSAPGLRVAPNGARIKVQSTGPRAARRIARSDRGARWPAVGSSAPSLGERRSSVVRQDHFHASVMDGVKPTELKQKAGAPAAPAPAIATSA